MGADPNWTYDPRTADLIRIKAGRLVGSYGFARDHVPDLCQDLWVHVARGMLTHDPGRGGPAAYQACVVTSKIPSLIRLATARKRDRRRERPIDAAPEQALSDGRDGRAQAEARMDVQAALARMPEDLRRAAALFMEAGSEAEAARRANLSRERVRGLRRRLERHLRAMGLGPGTCD